jgi:hypothetical protein
MHSGIHRYVEAPIFFTGNVELMSHLSVGRSNAACAIFDNAFWIVGGTESGATSMHTVESFDLRCATRAETND